jgi:hypothetical protein
VKTFDINAEAESRLPYAALYSNAHYIGLVAGGSMTLVLRYPIITVSLMDEKDNPFFDMTPVLRQIKFETILLNLN